MKRYLFLFMIVGLIGCSSELDRCIEANKDLFGSDDIDLDISLMDWGEIDFNKTSPKEIYDNFDRGLPREFKDYCPIEEFDNWEDYIECDDEQPKPDRIEFIKYEDMTIKKKLQLLVANYYWYSIVKDWDNSSDDYPLSNKHPKNWNISDLIFLKDFNKKRIEDFETGRSRGETPEDTELFKLEHRQTMRFIDTWTKVSIQARLNEMPQKICNAQGIY